MPKEPPKSYIEIAIFKTLKHDIFIFHIYLCSVCVREREGERKDVRERGRERNREGETEEKREHVL